MEGETKVGFRSGGYSCMSMARVTIGSCIIARSEYQCRDQQMLLLPGSRSRFARRRISGITIRMEKALIRLLDHLVGEGLQRVRYIPRWGPVFGLHSAYEYFSGLNKYFTITPFTPMTCVLLVDIISQ